MFDLGFAFRDWLKGRYPVNQNVARNSNRFDSSYEVSLAMTVLLHIHSSKAACLTFFTSFLI